MTDAVDQVNTSNAAPNCEDANTASCDLETNLGDDVAKDAEEGSNSDVKQEQMMTESLVDRLVQPDQRRSSRRRNHKTPTGRMPRQWLVDRCDGNSKYNPESRPPSRACWPPLPLKWLPDILEQNCFCECMGKTGCVHPENTRIRRGFFATAFIINVIGLSLLIVTAFAMTDNRYDLLWSTKMTTVWLKLISGPENAVDPLHFAIGLRAIAVQNSITNKTDIMSFATLCESIDPRAQLIKEANAPKFECHNCQDISKKIVPSLFLSMLSYIPNFTTDILRMYSNYDVNCQKFLASTFSWISLATSIYTWVNYRRGCFDSLHTEPWAVNKDFERVDLDDEDILFIVSFEWQAGIGQICLLLATLLKIIDIGFNIAIRTPTITRDHSEQVEYEWKYGPTSHTDGDSNTGGGEASLETNITTMERD